MHAGVAHIVGEASDLDWIWKFGCWILFKYSAAGFGIYYACE
jgi:hypothetical protein